MQLIFPRTLHARLILSHLIVALISIALISVFAGRSIINASIQQTGHNTRFIAAAASNALEGVMSDFLRGEGSREQIETAVAPLLGSRPSLRYTVFLPDGTPVAGTSEELPSPADPDSSPELWEALSSEFGEGERIGLNEAGEETIYIAVRIVHDNAINGILRIETPTDIATTLQSARSSLALLLLTDLLVAIGVSLFGWLLANTLVRPIRNLTETADKLARGDMGARVKPSGPHELQRLAQTFNTMAGRLQDHLNELRAFVANASHELRTPLTVVKLRAEALRYGAREDSEVAEQFLSEIEDEVDRLSTMVTDLLDLSRMEAGLSQAKQTLLNLGTIATDVYETFSIRAARTGVEIHLEIEEDLPPVRGNEDQLRRVLYNLVDNAIKYTPRGGSIHVTLQSGRNGQTLRLLVRDTGVGIAPEHLAHIFERFYRVEATRPRYATTSKGSGLGLAIAKSIVETHGGTIGASSQLHEGTTFWAELPAA